MAEVSKAPKLPHQDKHIVNIFFDTEADNENGLRLGIKSNKLVATFDQITRYAGKEPDNIQWIAVYKSPLAEGHFHVFIVLETDRWYYSLEVVDTHITVQRSVQLVYVRDMYQRESRQKTLMSRIFGALGSGEMDCMMRAYGKGTIRDVMAFLCEGSRLSPTFTAMLTHNQELVKWLFDLFNADLKEFHFQQESPSHQPRPARQNSVGSGGHENHSASLFFHSDSDNHTHRIHHSDLVRKYDEINGNSPDHIDTIELYETPLQKRLFLVIYTEGGWHYSIDEQWNVTIQRSKQLELVRDKFLDGHRDYLEERRRSSLHDRHRTSSASHEMSSVYLSAKGTKTVKSVMTYLARNAHLNRFFELPLAQRLFNKFNADGKMETAAGIGERHQTV